MRPNATTDPRRAGLSAAIAIVLSILLVVPAVAQTGSDSGAPAGPPQDAPSSEDADEAEPDLQVDDDQAADVDEGERPEDGSDDAAVEPAEDVDEEGDQPPDDEQDAGSLERVRVIVELAVGQRAGPRASERARGQQRRQEAQARRDIMQRADGGQPEVVHALGELPYFTVEIDADHLDALRSDPDVAAVEPDVEVDVALDTTVEIVGATVAEHDGTSLTGQGTSVAVLDTGVRRDHPFLGGSSASRVVAEGCFSANGSCPDGGTREFGTDAAAPLAGNSHGTHVAGIVGGLRSSTDPERGVAPGTDIVAAQVFSEVDGGLTSWSSDIVAALDWVLAEHATHGIVAANLSLGTSQTFSGSCDGTSGWSSIGHAVADLLEVGVLTVAASGNAGDTDGISAPACLSDVLAVGATTKSDSIASYSNISSEVDVLAPGSFVRSSTVGGYGSSTGTSMAAPHVAGAVALLRQAHPTLSLDELRAALTTSRFVLDDQRTGGSVTGLPRLEVTDGLGLLAPPPLYPDPNEREASVPWPLAGDWNGDGHTTPGWHVGDRFYLRNANVDGTSDRVVPFGRPGDWPVVGDWNGDGRDTVGVFQPGGRWLLRNTNTPGEPDQSFVYGRADGDVPFVGDWNGDGRDTVGVRRPGGEWLLRNSLSAGWPDHRFRFGRRSDAVGVVGDWNDDGRTTVGAFHPGGRWLLRNSHSAGSSDHSFRYGRHAAAVGVVGDWNGDGRDTGGFLLDGGWLLRDHLSAGFATTLYDWSPN